MILVFSVKKNRGVGVRVYGIWEHMSVNVSITLSGY